LRLVHGEAPAAKPMTVAGFGMQLHAATTVDGRDHKQLERLCRYLLRPPFAQDAVTALPDGRVRVRLKAPLRSGQTFVELDRDTFIARLAALVPPPFINTVRYYGALANRHALRERILPPYQGDEPRQLTLFEKRRGQLEALRIDGDGRSRVTDRDPSPSRIAWARLLARVFAIDVSVCRKCQGPVRVLRAVTDPDEIAELLHGARPPPLPSPPGQLALFG
jgi:hypothetical protein